MRKTDLDSDTIICLIGCQVCPVDDRTVGENLLELAIHDFIRLFLISRARLSFPSE